MEISVLLCHQYLKWFRMAAIQAFINSQMNAHLLSITKQQTGVSVKVCAKSRLLWKEEQNSRREEENGRKQAAEHHCRFVEVRFKK